MNEMVVPSVGHSSYHQIANEYYDSRLHPTCASLRELSEIYIQNQIKGVNEETIVEIGAGKSITAPILDAAKKSLQRLTLIDSSTAMLAYSKEWEQRGAKLCVADACATTLASSSADIVVASLGDPYNSLCFWREVARILTPNGVCHFTTPAQAWAKQFRTPELMNVAEFVRSDGKILYMPSPVIDEEEQQRIFDVAGLEIVLSEDFTWENLKTSPAPKLLCVSEDVPVVSGFSVRRR